MPPKCTTGKRLPSIQVKGCTMDGKPKGSKAVPAAKAAPAKKRQRMKEAAPPAPELSPDEIVKRIDRASARVYKDIMKSREAVIKNTRVTETQKRMNKALTKTYAAATRAKIIGRIKAARGRKHMAVHYWACYFMLVTLKRQCPQSA